MRGLAFSSQSQRRFCFQGKYASASRFLSERVRRVRRGRRAQVEEHPESKVMNENLGNYNSFSRKLTNPAEGRKDDICIIQFKLEFASRSQSNRLERQPPTNFSSRLLPNHQNQAIVFVSSDNFLALPFYITASLFLLRLFLHRTDPFVPLFYGTSLILPTLEFNITLA